MGMTKDWVGGMLGTPPAKRVCTGEDALPFSLNTNLPTSTADPLQALAHSPFFLLSPNTDNSSTLQGDLSFSFSPASQVNATTSQTEMVPVSPPNSLAPPQDTNDEEVHADEEIKQIADGIKKDIKEDIKKEVGGLELTTTIEQNPAISLADLKDLKPYQYELIINVWMFVMIMAFDEIDVLKKSKSIYKNLCVWVGFGGTKGKKKTTTDQSKALFTTFKRGRHKSFKHEGKASSKKENCIPLSIEGKTQVTDYSIDRVFILLKDLPQFLELGKINALISHLLLPVSTESKKK